MKYMSNRHGKLAENKSLLSVNIEKELKKRLAQLAKGQNRTLSNYVATELARHVATHLHHAGHKEKPPDKNRRTPGVGPADPVSQSA